jgi:lipid II isoglutaminyl synthase (glutamine-hydrolysing)
VNAVRLCHLYPGEMNIYADRGNIAVLERRLAWRGMRLEVTEVGVGGSLRPGAHDLYYLGGGQDRDQEAVAEDLVATKAEPLREAVAGGAAMLAVCGGFQLAGHGYTGVDGSRMPGVGLLDLDTVAGPTRLIGNLVIEAELEGERRTLVGFENHAGRTRLGSAATPLGRVVHGHGNNGEDGFEGAVQRRVVGTYLHGPLLPKNPWLADRLISWALEHRRGRHVDLQPLDDRLEEAAHRTAVARTARESRPVNWLLRRLR